MELWQILLIILAAEVGINMIGFGLIFVTGFSESWDIFVPMPSDFKTYTDMNWFGCTISFILLFLIFPLVYIPKTIYWICHI